MLSTFSFEPYFKSYRWFTEWSLEFLEIAKRPLSPSPTSLLCSRRRPPTAPPAGAGESLPGHYSASRWHPRVALLLLSLLLPRAGAPRPCHARRRVQKHPRRRHLAVAVESPLQWPPSSSSERPSPTNTPETNSYRPFALSSLPHRRTPPPLHPVRRQA